MRGIDHRLIGGPSSAASPAKSRLNTPIWLQRMKQLQIVLGEPYAAGSSRQRKPLRITKMMPLTIRRSSTRGTPCDNGTYGTIRYICLSVSQNRSLIRGFSAANESDRDADINGS